MESKKPPLFFKFRSSPIYILVAVSFSFFINEMLYGIITPIMPFVLSAMHQGIEFNSINDNENQATTTTNDVNTIEGDEGGGISSNTGILLAIYYTGFGGASPIFGYLSDKVFHNRKNAMLLGVCFFIGSILFYLFVTHYWMFALGRLLQGLGAGGVATMGYVLVADTSPSNIIGTQMGRAYMCYMAGLAAGGPIGALFLQYGYKVPFIFSLAFAGIELLLCIFMIERRSCPKDWFENNNAIENNDNNNNNGNNTDTAINPTTIMKVDSKSHICNIDHADGNQKENGTINVIEFCSEEKTASVVEPLGDNKTSESSMTTKEITTLQLLTSPRIWTLILVNFCSGWAVVIFEPTLPIYLNEEWGYNSSQIGLLLVFQLIPTAFASLLSGYMYDRIGARLLCFSTLLLGGISLAVSGIPNQHNTNNGIPLIAITAANEFFASIYKAATLPEASLAAKTLANGSDKGNARAYGLTNMAFAVGCLTSPLLSGYLYEQLNFFLMCIIMSCILFLSAPFSLIFLSGKTILLNCFSFLFNNNGNRV